MFAHARFAALIAVLAADRPMHTPQSVQDAQSMGDRPFMAVVVMVMPVAMMVMPHVVASVFMVFSFLEVRVSWCRLLPGGGAEDS